MKLKDAEKGKLYKLSSPNSSWAELWTITPVIEHGRLKKSPHHSNKYIVVMTGEKGTVLNFLGKETTIHETGFSMQEMRHRIFGSIFDQISSKRLSEIKNLLLIANTIKG